MSSAFLGFAFNPLAVDVVPDAKPPVMGQSGITTNLPLRLQFILRNGSAERCGEQSESILEVFRMDEAANLGAIVHATVIILTFVPPAEGSRLHFHFNRLFSSHLLLRWFLCHLHHFFDFGWHFAFQHFGHPLRLATTLARSPFFAIVRIGQGDWFVHDDFIIANKVQIQGKNTHACH